MSLSRSLFFALEEFPVLPVALGLELVHGDEAERRGVHAVALAGRRRTVVEDMSEVRVGMLRANLGARHEELAVRLRNHVGGLQRLREARPAGAAVVLVEGAEERLARDDVDVDA